MSRNHNGFHSRSPIFSRSRSQSDKQESSACRQIAFRLQYELPVIDGSRHVLLSAPAGPRHCATGCLDLAACLAEDMGRRVLLVDASPQSRELSRALDCADSPGFADLLLGNGVVADEWLFETTQRNVWFLPAGTASTPGQELAPERIQNCLSTLGRRHEYVLLYGGSILNNPVALGLAPLVGCVLLFATINESMLDDLNMAETALEFCHARKVGLVLTVNA